MAKVGTNSASLLIAVKSQQPSEASSVHPNFSTVCRVRDEAEIKEQYGYSFVALPVLEKLLGRENRFWDQIIIYVFKLLLLEKKTQTLTV